MYDVSKQAVPGWCNRDNGVVFALFTFSAYAVSFSIRTVVLLQFEPSSHSPIALFRVDLILFVRDHVANFIRRAYSGMGR